MTQAHSKPLSSFGIKKMCVGKILADLGEYRGFRVTRNTAGIRYIYRFRRSHSDKLAHGTLPRYFTPGNYSDPVVLSVSKILTKNFSGCAFRDNLD